MIVPIGAGTIEHIHRELGTRGYVYAVCDTLCGTCFVVKPSGVKWRCTMRMRFRLSANVAFMSGP